MREAKPFSWCRDPTRIEGDYQQYMRSGLFALCRWIKPRIERPSPIVMCEVGSAYGESAEIFSTCFDVVHCVDDFSSQDPKLPSTEESFDLRQRVNFRIVKHRCTSSVAAERFVSRSIDFVYIDANHRYEKVMADIALWARVPRHYFGGHDYGAPTCPGVKKAVDEVFGKPLKVFEDFSWVVEV